MKRIVILVLLILLIFGLYWFVFRSKHSADTSPKAAPVALKKHSENFNGQIDKLIAAYLDIKNAFIEDDTTGAKQNASRFVMLLDSIPVAELKKDTAGIFEMVSSDISDLKANTESLAMQTDIEEMRKDFNMITQLMYPAFFKTVNYEGQKLYLQNCPTAFGEDKGADWISNKMEVINPYAGKKNAAGLHCGEIKDTIKAP